MREDLAHQILKIQESVSMSAKPWFSESELKDLRCLIRLTTEFHAWLESAHLDKRHRTEVEFNAESTFSGVESFCAVAAAYRALVGAATSRVQWDMMSSPSLREQFLSTYRELLREGPFEPRCRILLDLFKMQIVIAGILYAD
jgi:hypothetical protein